MPTPPANATTTTFQVGTWNPLADTWALSVDLNDHVTWALHNAGLKLDQPQKVTARTSNIRVAGEAIARIQYQNRHIQASCWLRGASTSAMMASLRTLLAAVENPPICLRIALPGATQYSYADVLAVTHTIPSDPQVLLAGALTHVELDFECRPGLRGDRVVLQNLCWNAGFEAPSGSPVSVFSDPFANLSAYAVQAGGALGQDDSYYADAVMADAPSRYYRCDEASGTTAYDATGNAANGTYAGGVTLGTAGGLVGDGDTAVTLNGSTGYLSGVASGLPTGNNTLSLAVRFYITATPTGTYSLAFYGALTATEGLQMWLDTSGKLNGNLTGGTIISSASAVSNNSWHEAVITYTPGSPGTVTLYLDGASKGTATGTANFVATALTYGAQAGSSQYLTGRIDECQVYSTSLSGTRVSAHYNAWVASPSAQANTAILAAGNRISFGSPDWQAYNQWQIRMRYFAGATDTFYLHYVDANDFIAVSITATALNLVQCIAGTSHTLASSGTIQLVNEMYYWLTVSQFPAPINGSAYAYISAKLNHDAAGVLGVAVTNSTTAGPTFDTGTAYSGAPQIAATGGALGLGGSGVSGPHTVALFGPGGWDFVSATVPATQGQCSGAWEHYWPNQNPTNAYQGGPITGYGAARIDAPPGGTISAYWETFPGPGSPIGSGAMPTATGNTIQASAYLKATGLSTSASAQLVVAEWDAGGNFLRTTTVATITNPGASWGQIAGSLTMGVSTAYCSVRLALADGSAPGASANGTIWFDNVQVWDQTATGMSSMPYCELRFPQAPAQFVLSGLLGDMPAPAAWAVGTYLSSWASGAQLLYALGRRGAITANAVLVAPSFGYYGSSISTPVLDATQYGGYYAKATVGNSSWSPYALGPRGADAPGAYHLFSRFRSQDATPTSVQVRAEVQENLDPWFTDNGTISNRGAYYGPYQFPLSATGVWTLADCGRVPLPAFPSGALQDLTQRYEVVFPQWNGVTPGAEGDAGWMALLPIDGSLLMGTITNPSNSAVTVTTQYFWAYFDGLLMQRGAAGDMPATMYSIENTAVPVAAHAAGGSGTTTSGPINITPGGDPYPTIDPTLGQGTSQSGVNQSVAYLTDATGQPVQILGEVRYSPLYLYPR